MSNNIQALLLGTLLAGAVIVIGWLLGLWTLTGR